MERLKVRTGMGPFGNTYRGKRVLITGHTGFKGAWLALWLKELGAEVLGYSLEPPTVPNFFEAIGLEEAIISVRGDIRDESHLFSVFRQFKPEFVFHLAAQSLVRLSYQEPQLTYMTNVMGTVNVLEAIRRTKTVRVAVVVTSDKCYENQEWVYGYREIDPMGGYDPYSSSKGCAELVTAAYTRSFFNPENYHRHQVAVASVRAGNVIGGGDWGADRLIPDCIRALSRGEAVVIRHPDAVRPWQYIMEPLSGYLWLGAEMYAQGSKFNGAWNFGPEGEDMLTVREIVELTISLWGKGTYRVDNADHPHEAALLRLDCSKAHQRLRWRPVYNIYAAMEQTIGWYKRFYEDTASSAGARYDFSVEQIKEYVNAAQKKGVFWASARYCKNY
jgi:CDP-glucose 4,6-dehydratase